MQNKTTLNLKKIAKILLNIVFYSVIAIFILFSIANMKVKTNGNVANIFGVGFMGVLTNSMDGNEVDSFTVDDLLFVKIVDDSNRNTFKEGDIITFYSFKIPSYNNRPGLITHRIVEVVQEENNTFYITKGDHKDATVDDTPVNSLDVVAVYQSKWEAAGKHLKYLQTPNGFALFVIVPVAILLIFEGVLLARNIIQINNENTINRLNAEKEIAIQSIEAEKDKIRQQILEELKKEQNKA
jgi:signal peptidase